MTGPGPVVVDFLNTVTGSSRVLHRTFEGEGAYAQWASSVHGMVEVLAVRSALVPAAAP